MRWIHPHHRSEQIGLEFSQQGTFSCHLVREKNILVKKMWSFRPVCFTQVESFSSVLQEIKMAMPVTETPVVVGINHPVLMSVFPSVSAQLKPAEIFRYVEKQIAEWFACEDPLLWRYETLPAELLEPERQTLRVLAAKKSVLLQYQKLFHDQQFKLAGFSGMGCALFRLLRYLSPNETVLGFFQQDQHHYFSILHQGHACYEMVLPAAASPDTVFKNIENAVQTIYPQFSIQKRWTNIPNMLSENNFLTQPENIAETHAAAFGLALLGWK